jgi:hypothetical protein
MKTTKLLLALLALTTGLFAQDKSAVAPANTAKQALAREVIAAMHADKMFDGMAAQMKQMASQMAALPADATPEQRQKFEALQGKIMDLSMTSAKDLLLMMDVIYADVYSEEELLAMRSFFGSSAGQSMLAKQPQIMAKIMPLVQEMQRDLLPKIKQLVEETKAAK